MSRLEKLINRFKKTPRDFAWDEARRLLAHFGYELIPGSGSKRAFMNRETGCVLYLHEPHPRKELLRYQLKDIRKHLEQEGLI